MDRTHATQRSSKRSAMESYGLFRLSGGEVDLPVIEQPTPAEMEMDFPCYIRIVIRTDGGDTHEAWLGVAGMRESRSATGTRYTQRVFGAVPVLTAAHEFTSTIGVMTAMRSCRIHAEGYVIIHMAAVGEIRADAIAATEGRVYS